MQQFQLKVQGGFWKWLNLGKMRDKGGEFQGIPHWKDVLLLDNAWSSTPYTKDCEGLCILDVTELPLLFR